MSHDCLVLDLNFPDINGVFLFHQIKRINGSSRNARSSSRAGRAPSDASAGAGDGRPVLAKPFDFSRLSDILDGYCEST